MKILKKGILPEKHLNKFRGTCSDCHCQVEVNEYELLRGIFYKQIVRCPTNGCHSYIEVEEYVTRSKLKHNEICIS